jgi:hypothetical protein
MSKTAGIIVIILVGVALAVVIGLLGARGGTGTTTTSAAGAQASLCTSLTGLETATKALTGLDPSTASESDYQSAVTGVQTAWSQVEADASTAASSTMSTLDSAWDSFDAAVKAVPGSASVSTSLADVSTQGKALVSTTQTTLSGLSC